MAEYPSWGFADGEEIVPGRMAIQALGGGERNEAWLAWDNELHTVVVVKVLRPDHVNHERARKGLAREARILKRLQHPALVRMFDSDLNGRRPYLVLENLDGPRISTLIRNFGRLTPEQLVPLGLEVASALAYMHKAGYVHFDVKPRNIIMGASPTLIDLGLVRAFNEIRDLAWPIGTTEYMAPEQCDGTTIKRATPATDIWGLGVTLYEAATTRLPYPHSTDEVEYPQLQMGPAAPDKRVPDVLARLIMSCIAWDPAERPTAADVAAELEGMVEEARLVAGRRLRARYRR